MKTRNKDVKTVFLSGTDRVADILHHLHKALTQFGLDVWLHSEPNFPQLCDDGMTNCLEVVRRADMMLLIIDARSGSPYRKTGHSITEEEFNVAFDNYIPVFVFVRANILACSKIYHKHLSEKGAITPEQFSALKLEGDQGVHNFIERIMHKQRAGEPEIKWTRPFQKDTEIISFIEWLYNSSEGRLRLYKKNDESDLSLIHI